MSDLERIIVMLDKAGQPHYAYTQIGESGAFKVLVLDEQKDGSRSVAVMYFDLDSKAFVSAGTRWIDP